MKNLKKLAFALLTLSYIFSGIIGCGSEGAAILLTVDPAGPLVVTKGDTQQFAVNPNLAVSWSVEGGDDNGTIDATGLYTPPAELPINPQVTIRAQADGGLEATAAVDLRTGDAIAFGAAEQINDVVVPGLTLLAEIFLGGTGQRISVNLGSIQVDTIWTDLVGGNAVALYDSDFDFLGFGTDFDLSQDAAHDYVPGAVTTNSALNPGVVMMGNPSGAFRLTYLASPDQGNSFNAPVEIDPLDAGDDQLHPDAQLDGQDNVHLVYAHESSALGTGAKIRYTQSADQGATWSASNPVSGAASGQTFPNLAVSEDGQTVHVCWSDDKGSGGATFDIFVATSIDGGSSFAVPVEVTNSGTGLFCNLEISPTGDLFVAYNDNNDIIVARSSNGGTTFPASIQVNTAPTNVALTLLAMSVDSLGRIDVVWNADVDNSGDIEALLYSRSTDGGLSFSANTSIDGGVNETIVFPRGITHDLSGRAHVQFVSNVNNPAATTYDVFYNMAE